MKRIKMQAVGAALFLLLQMTSALSIMGNIPSQSSIHSRSKRSEGHTCKQEVVDNLAKTAKETCSQVEVVDKYIGNIQSRQQVPVPSFADRHGFKAILGQYNGDLKTAQEHCHPWRNGDNVVASLKQVVVAAQGFEPKFSEELVKNQARIKNLLENHEDIAAVEAIVAALQKDISEAREAIKATEAQAVISHLENVIRTKEEEINTKMAEHNVTQGRRELAELVKYLEFVKAGAVDIENQANTANTKITAFRENIIRDAGAFKRHRTNAQDGIAKLQQEKQNNNNAISSNQQSINNLRASINQENSQIASLNAQIAQAQREIREIEERINSNMRRVKKKKRFGRWFRFVPVVGWTIGNKFYKDAKEREERLANEKRHFIAEGNRQIQNLQAHIASRNQEINRHQQQINSLEAKNRELEQELQHFSQLDGNLRSLEGEVNAILPSIASAVSGVGKMKETFDSIQQNLGSAIARAKEAKTEAEIKNMRYFIYNEIEDIKCKWNSARNKIVLVGKCN
ncbi:putative leucine-rich repeat-containing protein DDB_G0290503 [Macrobrachium rosenbergii]|uniref:putative leucine-rich repeat-containing protein DDB_G0290503 n=1 Tax=Macrobrachium rosenbergii TaxID=79674 RepID=UPI0034D5C6EE